MLTFRQADKAPMIIYWMNWTNLLWRLNLPKKPQFLAELIWQGNAAATTLVRRPAGFVLMCGCEGLELNAGTQVPA